MSGQAEFGTSDQPRVGFGAVRGRAGDWRTKLLAMALILVAVGLVVVLLFVGVVAAVILGAVAVIAAGVGWLRRRLAGEPTSGRRNVRIIVRDDRS